MQEFLKGSIEEIKALKHFFQNIKRIQGEYVSSNVWPGNHCDRKHAMGNSN